MDLNAVELMSNAELIVEWRRALYKADFTVCYTVGAELDRRQVPLQVSNGIQMPVKGQG